MVLERLNRLTQDEVKLTAAQILEVVHGLAQSMRVVTDGEQLYRACHLLDANIVYSRQQSIVRMCSECPWYVFEVPTNHTASNRTSETMNEIASEMNKSKRQLMFRLTIADRNC